MLKRKRFKSFVPIIILFIVLNGLFVSVGSFITRWNADQDVLIVGNLILFIITLFSFLWAQKGLNNKNPHAFFRSIYGSIIVKLFVCLIAAFSYIATYKSDLNKPALFICMGLYLVYSFVEVSILTKLLRDNTHA